MAAGPRRNKCLGPTTALASCFDTHTCRNVKLALTKVVKNGAAKAQGYLYTDLDSKKSYFTPEGVLWLHQQKYIDLRVQAEMRDSLLPFLLPNAKWKNAPAVLQPWARQVTQLRAHTVTMKPPGGQTELYVPEHLVYALVDEANSRMRDHIAQQLRLTERRPLVVVGSNHSDSIRWASQGLSQGAAAKARRTSSAHNWYYLPLSAVGDVLMRLLWHDRRPSALLAPWLRVQVTVLLDLADQLTSELSQRKTTAAALEAVLAAAAARQARETSLARAKELDEAILRIIAVLSVATSAEVREWFL